MPTSSEQQFEQALKTFETQVAETTQFWFAAATMNEVAKRNTDTLNALNLTLCMANCKFLSISWCS